MKKILMILVITALVAPVFATPSVNVTIQDLGSGWAAINYAVTDANVVAFGLNVSVNSSAKITGIRNYKTGESTSASKGFGIFPGTNGIKIDANGNVTSWGTPIAANSEPGAAGTGFSTGTVVLELGALYDADANKPATTGKLCELQVSTCTDMSVAVNGTRCGKTSGGLDAGVVINNGGVVSALVPTMDTNKRINYNCSTGGCATCVGDVDGTNVINKNDVSTLITWISQNTTSPLWRKTGMTGDCKDVDKNGTVNKNDVSALITWIAQNTTSPLWKKSCSQGHP